MTTYAYLRDGSVLGRVIGWTGDVPVIDTTDRHPDPSLSGPSDLAGLPTAGEPDDLLSEAPDAGTSGGVASPSLAAGARLSDAGPRASLLPASRSAAHDPARYYGDGQVDARPSEAPDGEAVPRTRGTEPATTPDPAHGAAVGASVREPAVGRYPAAGDRTT